MKPRATPRSARPAAPSLVPLFYSGMRCPACASGNWHVGRVSAECGHCGYPVLLPHPEPNPEKDLWS